MSTERKQLIADAAKLLGYTVENAFWYLDDKGYRCKFNPFDPEQGEQAKESNNASF